MFQIRFLVKGNLIGDNQRKLRGGTTLSSRKCDPNLVYDEMCVNTPLLRLLDKTGVSRIPI